MNSDAPDPPDILAALLAGYERDHGEGRGRAIFRIPGGWEQGRAVFGGLIGALGLEAMAALVPEDGSPRPARSLQVGFVGPVEPEVEAKLDVELLRHGRSATVVRAQISQRGSVRTTLLGCFAAARESTVELQVWPRPHMRGPADLPPLPFVDGRQPPFCQYFEQRLAVREARGGVLDTGALQGWCRFREPLVSPGPAAITALVDAWPTPLLLTLSAPAPASTLTWSLDFVDVKETSADDRWWAYAVETDRASGGWVHTHARLWSPTGKLVATSRQTVALFA